MIKGSVRTLDEVFEKAKPHKYVRRTGAPKQYHYIYSMAKDPGPYLHDPMSHEMEHEYHRIDTMSIKALEARVKKITDPQKCYAFLIAIKNKLSKEYDPLTTMAQERLSELGYNSSGKMKGVLAAKQGPGGAPFGHVPVKKPLPNYAHLEFYNKPKAQTPEKKLLSREGFRRIVLADEPEDNLSDESRKYSQAQKTGEKPGGLHDPSQGEVEHEIGRINTMSEKALKARIWKVTDPQKAYAYARALDIAGLEFAGLAWDRLASMGYNRKGEPQPVLHSYTGGPKKDKAGNIIKSFTLEEPFLKAGKKGMKWHQHRPSSSEPATHVLKIEDATYEITPVKGGYHLTYETGGGHLPWGWTKPGSFASLGVHSSVEEAQQVAHKHQQGIMEKAGVKGMKWHQHSGTSDFGVREADWERDVRVMRGKVWDKYQGRSGHEVEEAIRRGRAKIWDKYNKSLEEEPFLKARTKGAKDKVKRHSRGVLPGDAVKLLVAHGFTSIGSGPRYSEWLNPKTKRQLLYRKETGWHEITG